MAEAPNESGNAPSSVETAPATKCCEQMDAPTAAECQLCKRPVCKNCQRFVNARRVCRDCLSKILAEIEGERASAMRLPPAIAGGIIAAILCGAAWTAMVVATKMEIGYAAVGVGLATGYGVLLGAGRKKSAQLQVVAVLCSIFGLVLGKYFTVAYLIVHRVESAKGLSYFDPRLFNVIFQVLPKVLSPWDALWAFIALRIAFRILRPTDVRVVRTPLSQ